MQFFNLRKRTRIVLLVLLLALSAVRTYSQNKSEPLIIGDPAPEIKFSKWLKGTPVTSMKSGHIYVLECWATWCGPCIAAMPHLTELAKKYDGKVTFIGMNVWEKIPDEQPYTSVIPNVTKVVKSLDSKMQYNVAIDDSDRYIAKNWLGRAFAPGIPTTFVIKDGVFMWMGLPGSLDMVLSSIIDGSYDLNKYRDAHKNSINAALKTAEEDRNLKLPIEEALKFKQYNKALELYDTLIARKPMQKYIANINKFKIILDYIGEKEAIQYSEDWKKRDGNRVSVYLAQEIVKQSNYSKETYLYAAQEFQSATGNGTNINPLYYDYIATCYFLAKDYESAVAWEQKAIETAIIAFTEGRHTGVILEFTAEEWKEKLINYQKNIKVN